MASTHTLSDSLSALRRWLREYEHGGVVLDSEAVTALAGEIKEMLIAARRMEHELDRLQWNERALADQRRMREQAAAVLAAASAPGGNVRLFPIASRPRSDGSAA